MAAAAAPASPAAASAASHAPASDAHVWSGAIQRATGASSGPAAPVGQVQAPVSSIQELLALKNQVLMALQKHGIGKPNQTGGNVPPAAQPAPGGAATPAPSQREAPWLPVGIGIAAALVAVALLLLASLMMRRRKEKPQPPTSEVGASSSPEPLDGGDAAVARAPAVDDETQGQHAGATPVASTVVAATSSVDAQYEERQPEAAQHDEVFDRATEPAGLEAAASLGADALPPETIETARAQAEEARQEPAVDEEIPHAESDEQEPAESDESLAPLPQDEAPVVRDDFAPQVRDAMPEPISEPTPEPDTITASEQPPAAPTEFPADAIAALDTLDMPLPPRIGDEKGDEKSDGESEPEPEPQPEPATLTPPPTGPAASPETIERQSVPEHEPPAPPVGDTIEAGTAGAGSIAGLGAARFGALSLDFDLNLPPDSAEPLPVFTPGQLARIARNKLDLAHEYIALGDLAGARTLIREVIESNDLATRADAQALLATLAPMS
ncbi:MAG TPA: FimV/HubP family polar landmark protein [Paraburkholderia sp.]